MIVDLSDRWKKIVSTGKMRNKINQNRGSTNFKVSLQVDDEEAHIWGVAGEIAIKLLLSLPLSSVWKVQTSGKWPSTDGTYNNKEYQVKTRVRKDADMLYNPDFMNLKADIYFLVSVPNKKRSQVEVVGWITKKELEKEKRMKNLGHGPVYLIKRKHFHPITSLIFDRILEDIKNEKTCNSASH